METLSHVTDVGPLKAELPRAIRGELRIAPDAYRRFLYGWKGGASDNWDELGVACEMVNLWRGHPTDAGEAAVVAFLRAKLADRRFMQKEFGSWIYLDLHVEPTLVQLAVARRLAETASEPWAELVEGLTDWLRALCGWLAWTGCWGAGRTWTRQVAEGGPGALLLVGRGDYNQRVGGALYCTLTGKRSWHWDEEWRHNLSAPIYLSRLGLGERRTGGDILPIEILEAIRDAFGYELEVLTRTEQQLVGAAIRNDASALKWATRLIGDWLPAEPVVVVRAAHGVSMTMLEAGKAPTATMYHCGWADDATTYAAGACNGLRGAQAEQVEAGMAAIDLELRKGFCKRTSGPERVEVGFQLPTGDLVAVLRAGNGKPLHATYYIGGVEQPDESAPKPPAPGPQPPPPKPNPKRQRSAKWLPLLIAAGVVALLVLRGC